MRRWLSGTANAFQITYQCCWHISNLNCRFITCLFLALKDMDNVSGPSARAVKKKQKDTIPSHSHEQEVPSHLQVLPLHVQEIPLHMQEVP